LKQLAAQKKAQQLFVPKNPKTFKRSKTAEKSESSPKRVSEPKNISISKIETKQEDSTFDNKLMPPVESSPRLDEE
jgi:hypothetical protein